MLECKAETARAAGVSGRKTAFTGILAAAAALMAMACDFAAESTSARQPAPLPIAARGSAAAPVDISTLAQLRAMSLTGNYRLIKDITMTSGDAGFKPIGGPFDPFRGTFDGNGFSIINFRTANNSSPGYYRGMFSGTEGAILRKIKLVNVNVVGEAYTGAIVGYMNNTEMTDSYVSGGTVSGLFNANSPGYALGMAVGHVGSYSVIHRCQASGSIKGIVMQIGGFIGQIRTHGVASGADDPRAKIEEIYTDVNVEATPPGPTYDGINVAAGGIVGSVEGAVISNIYAVGNVKGRGWPGGLVGRVANDDPNITPSVLNQGVYIGDVASTSGGPRAGAIGSLSGNFWPGSRCAVYYNKSVDGGVAIPTYDIACNGGKTTSELQNAHPSPGQVFAPYITGQPITQDMINRGLHPQCKLSSGSDNDWGFGTCDPPTVWKANSQYQYTTLARIPNPSAQRLQ